METMITKEQAMDLWSKFIESPNVAMETETAGYGIGVYMQFMLKFQMYGKSIANLTLITNAIYQQKEYNAPIIGTSLKVLYTPFGKFDLTAEEANTCLDAWEKRYNDFAITYDELLNKL